ncbi:MAG TPA: hypothetical protein PK668_20625 [Myxococcota bacterium]|nr:hypothetical protein [Myxococcota bacterium]HRY96236.1 hypothetical protein [Myxococcota bacterium]HSA22003.1 hypothetical protein [Myxococcota bacterium]
MMRALWIAAVGSAALVLAAAPGRAAVIDLDPGTTYQTLSDWEAICYCADESPAYPLFIGEVQDRALDELGITRIRLEVRSGVENDQDYYALQRDGAIDYATWRCNRYATVNDDADPDHLRPEGFHFTELDERVREFVEPLRQRMLARGQALVVNLNYVAFTGQITCGGLYQHDTPAEYAELMLATFKHLQDTFGWVPDYLEVILEPDNSAQWRSGTFIGQAIVATDAKLHAAGFHPRFIAPSNTNMGNAVTYFDDMIQVAGVQPLLAELCYHRYGGVSLQNLQAIAQRGAQHGVGTSMLEWWADGNTSHTLHEDLKVGNNAAWQRGVFCSEGAPDSSAALYRVDTGDPQNPRVVTNGGTWFMRQYMRFVRPGAVRIGAASDDGAFDPLAFVHPELGATVVILAAAGGSFTVRGLPTGRYGVRYTTGSGNIPVEHDVALPEVDLASGEELVSAIPAAGVLTVYRVPGVEPDGGLDGEDAGLDAGEDAGEDAGHDAGPDEGEDPGEDPGVDDRAGQGDDHGPDARPEGCSCGGVEGLALHGVWLLPWLLLRRRKLGGRQQG